MNADWVAKNADDDLEGLRCALSGSWAGIAEDLCSSVCSEPEGLLAQSATYAQTKDYFDAARCRGPIGRARCASFL
jgi:hypothetical protein